MTSERGKNSLSSTSGKSPFAVDQTVVRAVQEWMDHPSWDTTDTVEVRDEDIEVCLQLFRSPASTAAQTGQMIDAELERIDTSHGVRDSRDDLDDTPSITEPSQRFVFERLLGVGAFGIVVCVFDNVLGRRVALKILRPSLGQSRNLVRRFLREAQVAASLDHPGVVRLFETGRIGSHPYIMSAVIDGPNLSDYLKTHDGQLATTDAAGLIANVAEALQYAHERGVLHRDIKPSNILLTYERHSNQTDCFADLIPLITDFGLAKRFNDTSDRDANLSDGVQIIGTLRYSSPEQAAGRLKDVGIASDVYSLGTILYQCLSGSPPHDGDSNSEIMRRLLQNPVKSLRGANSKVSADLDNVVLKSLSRERQDRYATAGEFAADLRRYLRGEPVLARRAGIFRRIRFWAIRNPAIAAMSTILALTTVVAMFAIVTLYLGQRDAWKMAEEHRKTAMEAISESYEEVAETVLARMPNSIEVRRDLALKSVEKHKELADGFEGDPLSRYRLSVAYHNAAKVVGAMDLVDQRDHYFRLCMEILEQLIQEYPEDVGYQFDLFFNRHLWVVAHSSEPYEWRATELRKLVPQIEEICRMDPKNLSYRDVAAATQTSLADNLEPTRPMEAIPWYLAAAKESDELLSLKPDKSIFSKYALVGRARAAEIYLEKGKLAEAEELCQKMTITLAGIAETVREEIWFIEIEREPQDAFARLLVQQNRIPEAIASLRECDERYKRLREYFPDSSGFLYDHLRVLSLLARALMSESLHADAEDVKKRLFALSETPLAKTFTPEGQKKLDDLLDGL